MSVEKVGSRNTLVAFVVARGRRLSVEEWRGMILCSARAVMGNVIRSGMIEPPVGMSVEVAERELADLIEMPGDCVVGSAMIPVREAGDDGSILIPLRALAALHCYGEKDAAKRGEILGLLDEAGDLFRGDEFQAGWNRIVRFAQIWRSVGGDGDVAYWAISRGVTECDACEVFWGDPVLDELEKLEDEDAWEARHTMLVAGALRGIGEMEMAWLIEHDAAEHERRCMTGAAVIYGGK